MKRCCRCGKMFDLTYTKRSIGQSYGAGSYDDYYPCGDVCLECAVEEIGADWATGGEILDLMFQDNDQDQIGDFPHADRQKVKVVVTDNWYIS